MKEQFEIYWNDLTLDCQERLREFLGGNNGNYDVFPITAISDPAVVPIIFVSVWDDGNSAIATQALYDPEMDIVFGIDAVDAPEVDNLVEQYVIINDQKYSIEDNEDGTYTVIK